MGVNVTAVIVAAGMGSRMGFDKVFYKLKGRETVLYSLSAMEENNKIDEIVLVVSEGNLEKAKELCKTRFSKLSKIIAGGRDRTQSVINGVSASSGKYVAIHDGARPLVSQNIITECIENVEKYDAVTVYLPVTDTIKSFKGEFIEKTLDRDTMVSVQTPQCFNRELYLECIEKAKDKSFTDDCALFEFCKIPVKLIRGEEKNIKLTRKTDIFIAEALLEEENL